MRGKGIPKPCSACGHYGGGEQIMLCMADCPSDKPVIEAAKCVVKITPAMYKRIAKRGCPLFKHLQRKHDHQHH